jgi:hypothetical protein
MTTNLAIDRLEVVGEAARVLAELEGRTTAPPWRSDYGASHCPDEDRDLWYARGPMRKLSYEDRGEIKPDGDYIASCRNRDVGSLLAWSYARIKELEEKLDRTQRELAGWKASIIGSVQTGER